MSGKSKIALVAGAIALVAGVALLLAGPNPAKVDPRPTVDAPAPNSPPAPAPSASESYPVLNEVAPPELMEAKTALEAEYAERRKDLPEELAKPIDDDIGIIEGIAADLLAALASEPENEDLKRMLVQTYRNEMKLLKKALHLSSEEDDVTVDESEPTDATN